MDEPNQYPETPAESLVVSGRRHHEIHNCTSVAYFGNVRKQCWNINGKAAAGAKPNGCGMRLKLQFEQLFLRSELRAIRSMRFAMYSRVSGVQNRMQQTQIALLFPGLFVPPNGSASLESN